MDVLYKESVLFFLNEAKMKRRRERGGEKLKGNRESSWEERGSNIVYICISSMFYLFPPILRPLFASIDDEGYRSIRSKNQKVKGENMKTSFSFSALNAGRDKKHYWSVSAIILWEGNEKRRKGGQVEKQRRRCESCKNWCLSNRRQDRRGEQSKVWKYLKRTWTRPLRETKRVSVKEPFVIPI